MPRPRVQRASTARRPLRLRTLMAAIAVLALGLGWARSRGSLGYALIEAAHSRLAWAIAFGVPFAIARTYGPPLRRRPARVATWGLLALAVPPLLYLAWAHHRVAHGGYFDLVHDFPHPDGLINALDRWFDARRPTIPGFIKLHSEYPTVAFVLGLAVIGLYGLIGLLLGLLIDPSERTRGQESRIGPA